MIELTQGDAVLAFLDRITTRPRQYERIVICVPFIGEEMVEKIALLFVAVRGSQCKVRIISSPASIVRLTARLAASGPNKHFELTPHPRLHAKLYLAMNKEDARSEAIVTSANLTRGGTRANIELGVRAVPTSMVARRLVRQIEQFANSLPA